MKRVKLSLLAVGLVNSISWFFRMIGLRSCRFYPTCSAYSTQAFQSFSFPKALFLTLGRLLRCQPFSAGGYDPLPEKEI